MLTLKQGEGLEEGVRGIVCLDSINEERQFRSLALRNLKPNRVRRQSSSPESSNSRYGGGTIPRWSERNLRRKGE